MISGSLKGNIELFQFPPTLWPKRPFWEVYSWIMFKTTRVLPYPAWVYIKNSIILVAGQLFLQVPISALTGYALSKLFHPRWSRIMFMFFVGTLMVPGIVSLVPSYLILSHFPWASITVPKIPFTNIQMPSVRLLNSYWAVILPSCANAFNILLFKGFFDAIPNSIIQAARVDGGSEFHIFRTIILPMSRPVLAVVGYFTFTGAWNSFIWPMIVMSAAPEKWPLALAIYTIQSQLSAAVPNAPPTANLDPSYIGMNAVLALSVIESIPVIVMFAIFREQLMKGIKIRGFK
ncbi:MAG TPA: carbohydrate ABC transporter permease [Firmicutes bacterium]|nr:carbohydrate ABC transporter permease [Bacillota bacterium]